MNAIETLLNEAKRGRELPPPPMRRYLREQVGLTQGAIAAALDVDRCAVSRWESGQRTPRGQLRLAYVALLERLAKEAT